MKERTFRIIIGGLLLAGLYLDQPAAVWTVIAVLLFQGVTNWRIPRLISRLRYGESMPIPRCFARTPGVAPGRFNFEPERALCLIVSTLLIFSYGFYGAPLWFLPWFIGFALFAAGLSGICPMILALRRLGFQ